MERCAEGKLKRLTGCVADSHHTVWGSLDVKPKGKICDLMRKTS